MCQAREVFSFVAHPNVHDQGCTSHVTLRVGANYNLKVWSQDSISAEPVQQTRLSYIRNTQRHNSNMKANIGAFVSIWFEYIHPLILRPTHFNTRRLLCIYSIETSEAATVSSPDVGPKELLGIN
eukprot:1036923-Amphidinium_carterae.2